jgi:hypothetical protein
VHTIKFPSDMSEEAKFHLDLCLQYMEIIGRLKIIKAEMKIFTVAFSRIFL